LTEKTRDQRASVVIELGPLQDLPRKLNFGVSVGPTSLARFNEFQLTQLATERKLGLAIAVAKKTVVTDALKTVRQDMKQEAANEFVGLQGHDFLPVVMAIILPAECDLPLVDVQEPVIGNGNAMCVLRIPGQDDHDSEIILIRIPQLI